LPTGFVIFLGILFEFIADIRRWFSDRKINYLKVKKVLFDGE
jgi:hypothetical protein